MKTFDESQGASCLESQPRDAREISPGNANHADDGGDIRRARRLSKTEEIQTAPRTKKGDDKAPEPLIKPPWWLGIKTARVACALCLCTPAMISTVHAQVDPEPRNLLQLGVNQSLHDDGPTAAYAFYYWNMPDVPATNMTLRLAIAPVYADVELGFKGLLGENTDLSVGVFGGGFYNSYNEVRQGNFFRDESFDGHGGGAALSLYHNFTPAATVPLNGIIRASMNYHVFSDSSDTAVNFGVPDSQPFYTLHTGLRWGGKEPLLTPRLAAELSVWYDLEYRPDHESYGFGGDRELNSSSHRFLGNAQLLYTMPRSEHYLALGLMGGAVINADRFSAYRLGGALPFTSEYPLFLPGYFYDELSAQHFGLFYGLYAVPFGPSKSWSIFGGGATAVVDYVDGLEQSGNWNTGVTGGLSFKSKNRRLQALVASGYGIDAIRSDGRGGYSVAFLLQYNFGKLTSASDRAFENLQNAPRLPFRFSQ
jgi:hypothetical protein